MKNDAQETKTDTKKYNITKGLLHSFALATWLGIGAMAILGNDKIDDLNADAAASNADQTSAVNASFQNSASNDTARCSMPRQARDFDTRSARRDSERMGRFERMAKEKQDCLDAQALAQGSAKKAGQIVASM